MGLAYSLHVLSPQKIRSPNTHPLFTSYIQKESIYFRLEFPFRLLITSSFLDTFRLRHLYALSLHLSGIKMIFISY